MKISVISAKHGYQNGTAQIEIKIVLPPLYVNASLFSDVLNSNKTARLNVFVSDENEQLVDSAAIRIEATNGLVVGQTDGYTSISVFATTLTAPYVIIVTVIHITMLTRLTRVVIPIPA